MSYDDYYLRAVHQYCSCHRDQILQSSICGCFYCLEIFAATEINEWIDEGKTALCPRCEIDSVLGNAPIFGRILPVEDKEFLSAMHKQWF